MTIGGRYAVTAHEIRGGRQLADLTVWLDQWEAVDELNDLGTFSGTVLVTPECCEVLLPLEPWLTELRVTHGGTDVAWEGVLTSSPIAMGMDPGSQVELAGTSMLGWLNWRVVRDVIDSTDAPIDACLWALQVIQSALEVNDPNLLEYLATHSGGEAIERAAVMGKIAWDSNLKGILGKQVDIANHGRAITVRPAGSCFGDLGAWGANLFDGKWVLQRESTRDQPFATVAWVRGADGLLMSVGSEVNGLLVETAIDDNQIIDQEQAYAAGASAITLDGRAPLQFLSDNAVIACDSGIDPCDLMPGACVVVQVESCGQPHEQQMRVLSVRHAGNAAGEDETEVELAVLPNTDRKVFPEPGPTEPSAPGPARATILYDSRTWNGNDGTTAPADDGRLQNMGTGRTDGFEAGGAEFNFDLFLGLTGVGGSIIKADVLGFGAAGDYPGPGDWDFAGGMPQSAAFTFAIAFTDPSENDAEFGSATILLDSIGVYAQNDGTTGLYIETSANADPVLETTYSDPTPLSDEIVFVELVLSGDAPSVGIWRGEELVYEASTSSLGTTIDTAVPTITDYIGVLEWDDYPSTPGDPWNCIGIAMIRARLTDAHREAWRSYFLD